MFLIKVKGEQEYHPWYNKPEDVFLSYVAIQLTRMYGRKISQDDMEVHVVLDRQESELCKMHNEKSSHTSFKIKNKKIEYWEYDPIAEKEKKLTQEWDVKKVISWERNPEAAKVVDQKTGESFTDFKKLKKNVFE